MRIKTSHGNITAPYGAAVIIKEALLEAAKHQRENNHLKAHEFYMNFAKEIQEGIIKDGK